MMGRDSDADERLITAERTMRGVALNPLLECIHPK
jgi:hypothetical protein